MRNNTIQAIENRLSRRQDLLKTCKSRQDSIMSYLATEDLASLSTNQLLDLATQLGSKLTELRVLDAEIEILERYL